MGESKLAVIAALAGNLLIAALKLVAGLLGSSAAMLAEGAHSLSDCGNQLLLLVGMARSSRPPSPEHPFGPGKDAYFWPFLVAVLLFGVAGAYSAIEGARKIAHPHAVEAVGLSLVVLAVSFGIELVSLAMGVRQARKEGARGSLRSIVRDTRDAALLTVLVEDTLALLGLPIAAAALLVARWTGDGRWDGAGSLVIGLVLMGFAAFLGSRIQRLLVGVGLTKEDQALVLSVIAREPAVQRAILVQSMHLGPSAVLLACELEMRPGLAGSELTGALRRLEKALVEVLPSLKHVYLEPHTAA